MIQEIKPWLCWRFLPKCCLGLQSFQRSFERESAFRFIHMAVDWPHSLTGSSLRHQHLAMQACPHSSFQQGGWLCLGRVIEWAKEGVPWMEDTVSLLSNFGRKFASLWQLSIHFKGQPTPNSTQVQISGGRKALESILENAYHILWSNLTCKKTHGL